MSQFSKAWKDTSAIFEAMIYGTVRMCWRLIVRPESKQYKEWE
jgi:hypothetical protein